MLQDRLNHYLVNHPLLVVALCIALVAILAAGLPPQITTDFEEFFPDEDENLVAYHHLQTTYTNVDNVYFAIAPKSGVVFSRDTLSIIGEMTEAAWQLPYSQRVDSLTNFQHTIAEDDDLLVEDLIPDPANASDAELVEDKAIALAEPQLVNRLISPTAKVAGINVIVNFHNAEDKSKAIPEVVKAAREFREQFEARYPQADFYLVGKVMNNNA